MLQPAGVAIFDADSLPNPLKGYPRYFRHPQGGFAMVHSHTTFQDLHHVYDGWAEISRDQYIEAMTAPPLPASLWLTPTGPVEVETGTPVTLTVQGRLEDGTVVPLPTLTWAIVSGPGALDPWQASVAPETVTFRCWQPGMTVLRAQCGQTESYLVVQTVPPADDPVPDTAGASSRPVDEGAPDKAVTSSSAPTPARRRSG